MLEKIFAPIKNFFDKPRLGTWTIPLFILVAAFFALGALTFNLGFYQDDWNHVYALSKGGYDAIHRIMFADGRPLLHILFNALFAVLGIQPFAWHAFVFLTRALGAIAFWAVLNKIWKGYEKENAIAALLFLFYPVFLLQPMAMAFSIHWTLYLVYMLSVWLMLHSLHSLEKQKYIFAFASVILQAFHLLMIEYFIGVELFRPIFLWMAFRADPLRDRVKRVLRAWLPYLCVSVLYIIYRASYNRIYGFERFGDMTLFALMKEPASIIPFYFLAGLRDFTEILLASWYETLKPALFDFSAPSRVILWTFVLAAIFGIWSYLKLLRGAEREPRSESQWARNMFWCGLCAMLFGILPGWVIGNTVYGSNPLWNDRFALAAMFGAGMAWTGLIFLLVPNPNHRYLIFGIFISLAMGINMRAQLDFKRSWEKQLNFYWQLTWRAPSIEPRTLLISDGEFLFLMGTNPAAFAINTLYPQSVPMPQVAYWLSNGPEHLPDWDEFREGAPFTFSKYASNFSGNTKDSLTISFLPEENQCLWILPPDYANFRLLSAGTRETIPVSALERIKPEPLNGWVPPADIFGEEPLHSWCYYFEKADLAAQFQDWDETVRLWNEAREKSEVPGHGLEYIPFIRAYAYTGQWEQAVALTVSSSKISKGMGPPICDIWARIKSDTMDSSERRDALRKLNERFQCGL